MYRGSGSPGLQGTYIYSDYCSGIIWGLQQQGGSWVSRTLLSSGFSVTTFGVDESGEIYVANANDGTIWRLGGTSQGPQFTAQSVVNAASFVPGMTAGSLATVFATGVMDNPGIVSAPAIPLPANLNGVSMTVNGITAPILAVANSNGQQQVNFQVPFGAAGRSSANVVVTRAGVSSPSVSVPVSDVQPGIYSGVVVHNSDYSLVNASRPLVRGEYAFLYAEGLGAVANQPADGAAAPSSPLAQTRATVQVSIGGVPCEVQYSGLAPGFVGLYQVNFKVPTGAPSGNQDLVISIGSAASPAVKVAVQ